VAHSAGRDRCSWTGRQFDAAIGLQYNRARYYDPATGRWMGEDPMGFDAGDGNFFRYGSGQPTNKTDPSGLQPSLGLASLLRRDNSEWQLLMVGGRPFGTDSSEPLRHSTFDFHGGTGTVRVYTKATVVNPTYDADSGQLDNAIYIQFTSNRGVEGLSWIQFRSRVFYNGNGERLDTFYHKSRYYDEPNDSVIELWHPARRGDTRYGPYLDVLRPEINYDNPSTKGLNGGMHYRSANELSLVDFPGFEKDADGVGRIVATYDSYLVDWVSKEIYYHVEWSYSIERNAEGNWTIPQYRVIGGDTVDRLPSYARGGFTVGYKHQTDGVPYNPVKLENPFPVADE
jgi:RHS repeat-associated protein